MSDTFRGSCGPSTSDGYIRGRDEALTEIEGTGTAAAARSPAAGRGGEPGGGRTKSRGVAPNSDALGPGARSRRCGGLTPIGTFWSARAAEPGAARGAGAGLKGRSCGGRLRYGTVDGAADSASHPRSLCGLDGLNIGVEVARETGLERA